MNTSVQLLLKEQQYKMGLFGNRFLTNKPVVYQGPAVSKPYNNLFYWSHGFAKETSQFDLHPHEGFEILSYVIEGTNDHYDTATERWTPLGAGDFQVIQAGSGIAHAERLNQGTRAFQIWFDPDFSRSLKQAPDYADYHASTWSEQVQDEVLVKHLVGGASPAKMNTPGLQIQQWRVESDTNLAYVVEEGITAHFYVIAGEAQWEAEASYNCPLDSSLRLNGFMEGVWSLQAGTVLFLIKTLQEPGYQRIWQGR